MSGRGGYEEGSRSLEQLLVLKGEEKGSEYCVVLCLRPREKEGGKGGGQAQSGGGTTEMRREIGDRYRVGILDTLLIRSWILSTVAQCDCHQR